MCIYVYTVMRTFTKLHKIDAITSKLTQKIMFTSKFIYIITHALQLHASAGK